MFTIVFALLFIAIGVFMLVKVGGSLIITIIAVTDIVFGLVLAVSTITTARKKRDCIGESDDEHLDVIEQTESNEGDTDISDSGDGFVKDDFDSLETEDNGTAEQVSEAPEDPQEKLRRLSEREVELKEQARRAVAEAKASKEEAEELSAAAKDAEDRLVEAEQGMRLLVGAEQQAALKRVDQLANEARDLSQRASVAKKNARVAAAQARKAADEHSAAMDAAAQAMMELEELDFSEGDSGNL